MATTFPEPKTAYSDVCAVTTAELIEAYRESIEMMREACKEELNAHKIIEKADPNFGDDLYLLRYVLSYHKKGPEECWKALFATMQWRQKHCDLLYRLRVYNTPPPLDDLLRPAAPTSPHFRTRDGHLIILVRNGCASVSALIKRATAAADAEAAAADASASASMSVMTPTNGGGGGADGDAAASSSSTNTTHHTPNMFEEMTAWMTFSKEWLYAKCDEDTRRGGKLIKTVALLDFTYASFWDLSANATMKEAMSIASHESELYYPQLLRRSVIFKMPTMVGTVMALIMKLLPRAMQEKISICNEWYGDGIAAYCERELGIAQEDLPTYLGGTCDCEGGCIKGVPNDLNHQLTEADVDATVVAAWPEYMGRADRPIPVTGQAIALGETPNGSNTDDLMFAECEDGEEEGVRDSLDGGGNGGETREPLVA